MVQKRRDRRIHLAGALAAVAVLIAPSIAAAHEDAGVAGGFLSGFTHPLFGWDHVAAMVAVGLWARSWARRRSGSCRSCSRSPPAASSRSPASRSQVE
jgi:hydrogenase/urease accessory protein HupE